MPTRFFRVTQIPLSWSLLQLTSALEFHQLRSVRRLQVCASVDERTNSVILALAETPPVLSPVINDPLSTCLLSYEGHLLAIDQHFLGLTLVSSPPGPEIQADIIAIHGLSGHAFGSWLCSDAQSGSYVMWLQDFLAQDLPGVRVLIYGYEARLDKITTVSRLHDYKRGLINHLLPYRVKAKSRPVVLFGHSFGGIMISQVLQSAKLESGESALRCFLESVRAVFFFAVPHRGLRTNELKKLATDRSDPSKTKLLLDLEKDSEVLRQARETLAVLSIDIKFVSIYEEQRTASVVKNTETGTWTSAGEPELMVEEDSAVLYLPYESRIPAVADHRSIIKHSYKDQTYFTIRDELSRVVHMDCGLRKEAPDSVDIRQLKKSRQYRQELPGDNKELHPLGIAFGLSGSSKVVDGFVSAFYDTIAGYDITERTLSSFIEFRLQSLKFIAWAETMRVAWREACSAGVSLAEIYHEVQLAGISNTILISVEEATGLIHEVQRLKTSFGSFENKRNDATSDIEEHIDEVIRSINSRFTTCLKRLGGFMATARRKDLVGETLAHVLAVYDNPIHLQKIEQLQSTSGSDEGLTDGVRLKRLLQSMRISKERIYGELRKSIECVKYDTEERLTLATYTADTDRPTQYRVPHKSVPQRVLLEWVYTSNTWQIAEVNFARERLTDLVQELGIAEKPHSLRILQTIAIIEDSRAKPQRFGIVSHLPPNCDTTRLPFSLGDYFSHSSQVSKLPLPSLSERFRLALDIATGIHGLHSSGWLHRDITSAHVVFLHSRSTSTTSIRDPYLTGFGYARPDQDSALTLYLNAYDKSLYKHPVLRSWALSGERPEKRPRFCRAYDIYSLGVVLLEIGLWDSVKIYDLNQSPSDFTRRLVQACNKYLGHQMGAVYKDVVLRCLNWIEEHSDVEDRASEEKRIDELMRFYWSVVRELGKCHCK